MSLRQRPDFEFDRPEAIQPGTAIANDPLWTVEEAALYLQVKPKTLYGWARQRKVPVLRAGSALRFRRADLDAWLARR